MSPNLLWLLLAVAVIGAILAKPRRTSSSALDRPWPLEAAKPLLTEPEQVLYRRLVQALPGRIVLSQVQLLQALRFKRGARSQNILNRISQLSIDFLVLDPDTSIVAAIELDDSSHGRSDRKQADARKAHALQSAGIRLLRWKVAQMPDLETIEAAVVRAAGSKADIS